MNDEIIIKGIRTNNLKEIDFYIKKRSINLIIGNSGSGKSSLAYDTVAQIGQHELLAMYADDVLESSYKVNSYENMIVAVPIKQSNHNNNLHSTIGTYFGLNRNIAFLFATILNLREDIFTLNKVGNLCEYCHGLGYIKKLDENRIIDYSLPLCKNPIRSWNRYKDFYSQIITQYCEDLGIDSSKTFRQISIEERQQILYGESDKKYSIRYKKTNTFSQRTTKYYGAMTMKPMIVGFTPSKKYFSDIECFNCYGKKYSSELENYKIYNLSIGSFMMLPFSELIYVLSKMKQDIQNKQTIFSFNNIYRFVNKAIELNLGHLCFHRSIPTLSGGEFQRLKMVQVFNSQLTDLLIVLDEPLAGLSNKEKDTIFYHILELSKNHTILIVDHGNAFIDVSSTVTALGFGGGVSGGYIIDYNEYLKNESAKYSFDIHLSKEKINVNVNNNVYKYTGVSLNIFKNSMNLITGSSGIGKSTLLREYFSQFFEHYLYINQKPLIGNKNSFVVTVLDIFNRIQDIFEKNTNKDKKFFSNLTGSAGMCPYCNGAGYIEYGYDNRTKVRLRCEDCEETGFNKIIKKYKIKGKNMFDIWKMTIDEAIEFFSSVDNKISSILKQASSLMLGHLRLGQATIYLSGGENIRIKTLKAARTSATVIGIDEPFKGLGLSEIYRVSLFLNNLVHQGKTIIVIDHSEIVERYFQHKIILINKNGILTDENH